jgi:ATP-dependent Lon protease
MTNESTDVAPPEQATTGGQMAVLPLRDVVVYPHMVIPLFVGREKSIRALESAMEEDKRILLLAQKSADVDEPGVDDLYQTGTVANILQMLKLPDGTVKVLVEGAQRAAVDALTAEGDYFVATTAVIPEPDYSDDREVEVMTRSLMSLFDQYVKLNKKVPQEILSSLQGIEEPGRLADTVAAHMSLKIEQKQGILEVADTRQRLEHLMGLIEGELDILQVEKRIRSRVKQQMEKSQREYYLNEQMKAIQKELGELEDVPNEIEDLEQKIKDSGMSDEAREKAEQELSKFKMMSPMSAEATVVRNYLEWMVDIPWEHKTRVRHDLKRAQKTLDADHYGLEKVKERILEHLAVQKRKRKLKGPILCLVGPPGVGKTSLGQSIARSINRRFTRMALGGVRDEAEIRGHRRTYIGSLPGKIIQNLTKTGVRNPLFLLDEVDKMAMDFRGDPASALLEVLDPEQNAKFTDHYLEVEFDLSDIMFVCTANTMDIPAPLMDRMEIIRLPGYTEEEKVAIAERHLLPKQVKANGLKKNELEVSENAMRDIVRYYTREAGVRNLEREVARVARKVVRSNVTDKGKSSGATKRTYITTQNLDKYLGVRQFRHGLAGEEDQVGRVTGLAWTETGGELLTIEAAVVPGTGKTQRTGQLGEVMRESIEAATTIVRSRAQALGIDPQFYQNRDIHIHVPEGAIPKDGPSAGTGMCTALISALTDIPVRADVAMTGEITLRGEVLAIGGLKEKLLAAQRGGINTVLIPEENRKDLSEVTKDVKGKLDIRPVRWIDEILSVALTREPAPLAEGEADSQGEEVAQGAGKGQPARPH